MDYRWQGPFVITTVPGKGLYSLTERDGNQVVGRVNAFHLKRYFSSPAANVVSVLFARLL